MDYIAIIHKDAQSDFGVSFPDFQGCVTAGSSVDEAKDMAIEALNGHVACMIESGENIPQPSNLEAIMKEPDFIDGVAFLVTLVQPDKTVRVNITLTQSELNAIDSAAIDHGMKRSAYLVKAGIEAAHT